MAVKDFDESLTKLKALIAGAERMVFFGGAGVSTESGIPDFRSASGLYNRAEDEFAGYSPEEIVHANFFRNNTALFYKYYFTRFIYPSAQPNAAHAALAALERAGGLRAVVTQNVDGLHQQAGSKNVIELHGSVRRNFCTRCGTAHTLEEIMKEKPNVPQCKSCGGVVKPDVVLYGEALDGDSMSKAVKYISEADVFIVGGTSLSVYPAAGLVSYYTGGALVLINRDATAYDGKASLTFRQPIGEVLGSIV
ncbi:MAG: NAD-dependent protein deacylase [Clostridiales bacterium]|nr:NAD-dependent protein deacylase [Clostridiales bacterium]